MINLTKNTNATTNTITSQPRDGQGRFVSNAKEAKKRYEEKNKALDEVLVKLKALEKEIEEIQKK